MASQYRRRSLMLNTIAKVAQGNPTIITDSSSRRLQKLNIYGQSEQDSTTGKNLLNPTGATKVGWNIALPNFKLEIGKTYTYTAPSTLTGSKSAGLYAAASDTKLANYLTVGKTATFTVPEEADLSQGILLAGGSADSLVLGDELTAMVELGSVATEFEPYTGGKPSPSPDYPQEIISKEVSEIVIKKSLNLFDKSKIEKLKAITNDGNFEANNSSHISGYISVKPNTMYSMTGTNQTRGKFYTYDKKGIGMDYNFNPSKDTTFQTDENTYFIQFCLPASKDGSNIMLNEGDILAPYMDYSEEYQKITLSEPITLRGVHVSSGGNVTIDGQQYASDVICEKDGVIGVDRNVIKAYLKDAETIVVPSDPNWYDSAISYSYEFKLGSLENAKIVIGRCEYFKSYSFGDFYNKKIESGIMTNQNDYAVANIPKSLGILETLDEFKQWLTDNNVYIERVPLEPTFEPLPDEIQAQYKALKSYYPNTVINTGCWNEVTYSAKRGG